MTEEFWPKRYVRRGYRFDAPAASITVKRVARGAEWVDIHVESIGGEWDKRMPLGIPWSWDRVWPPLEPGDLA